MSDRELIEKNAGAYMIVGDMDKPFHRPECECVDCEAWRMAKGRPTHKELQAKPERGTPGERA